MKTLKSGSFAFVLCALIIPGGIHRADAAAFVDTFDTGINAADWYQRDGRPTGPYPEKLTVENGVVVAKSGDPANAGAGLFSMATHNLEQSFSVGLDVSVSGLLPAATASSVISLLMTFTESLTSGGPGMSHVIQLESASEYDNYGIAAGDGVTASQRRGDPTPDFVNVPEDNWPLNVNHFTLNWDAELGILTSGYDGIGGRQYFDPIPLYFPSSPYTPASEFRFAIFMAQSTDAYADNRLATTFDNFTYTPVPEPSGAALLMASLGMLTTRRGRRNG